MAKTAINNVKLGLLVLAGLFFIILILYMIGKNRNFFGPNYELKARFENVNGLMAGNNVRYSGIDAGTVKNVKILNDTVIEVTMLLHEKMNGIIRVNAIASISTDGFVGNKIVNITPVKQPAPFATEGTVLASKKAINTDDMLEILSKTNKDIAVVASGLKTTVQQINTSTAFWDLLNDKTIPEELKASMHRIRHAAGNADEMTANLNEVILGIKNGNGSLGVLIKDTSFVSTLNEAVEGIRRVGEDASHLASRLNTMASNINTSVQEGNGPANALLKDSEMVAKFHTSLDNIQKGTDAFNQNMEALKTNFLFRGYFKKQEKKRKQELKKAVENTVQQ